MSTPFLLTVAAIYFMNQIATYGVIFFVPSIVQAMDVTDTFLIGLISGVVGIGAVIGVLVVLVALPAGVEGSRSLWSIARQA